MTEQCRRLCTSKAVLSNRIIVTVLTALLSSCGGGAIDDPRLAKLAAALPTAEATVSSTVNSSVVTGSAVDVTSSTVVDEESDLPDKEILIAAITTPNLSPFSIEPPESKESIPPGPTEETLPLVLTGKTEITDPPNTLIDSLSIDNTNVSEKQTEGTVNTVQAEVDERVTFSKFRQNDLPSRFRTMFGCGGSAEADWLTIPDSWPVTWPVNSRSEFDIAVANMEDGDRILISSGTDLGSVELKSSGSQNAKKYIVGVSNCDDATGPDSFSSSTRFTISGNDWVIMNLKFKSTGNKRAFHITGARNWVYNNRIDRAGEVLFTPQGTPDAPTTSGNKVIGNYFNGANDAAGVRMLNPFGNKQGASVHDLVIGGNTFEDFQEPKYQSKVITDTSFGWNYPYGSETDMPGANTFTELGWNHFIDCIGEVPTSKTRRWMIHNNLYEATPAYSGGDTTHISLRSGDDKLVFRNIFLDGQSRIAQNSMRINGKRSHGFFNVSYRSDSAGLGLSWTTTESFSSYPFPSQTFVRNERLEDINWRYNFFLGDGGDTDAWAKYVVISGYDPLLPPINNTVRENFYSSENPDRIGFIATDHARSGLGKADWENNNPDAVRGLQHFARKSGNESTLDGNVTIPTSVTVKGFWLNGEDVTVVLPPWIDDGGKGLIDLID